MRRFQEGTLLPWLLGRVRAACGYCTEIRYADLFRLETLRGVWQSVVGTPFDSDRAHDTELATFRGPIQRHFDLIHAVQFTHD